MDNLKNETVVGVDSVELAYGNLLKMKKESDVWSEVSGLLADRESLGMMFDEYKRVNDKYIEARSNHGSLTNVEVDQADGELVEQREKMDVLFDVWFDYETGVGLDLGNENGGGLHRIVSELGAEHLGGIVDYLISINTRNKRYFLECDPKREQVVYGDYDSSRKYVNRLLIESGIEAAKTEDYGIVAKVVEQVGFSCLPREYEGAGILPDVVVDSCGPLVADLSLNLEQRRMVVRAMIVAFGPIETADLLARRIMSGDETVVSEELSMLYSLVQGEKVDRPVVELEEVYAKSGYADQDRPEQTKKEADEVQGLIDLAVRRTEYYMPKGGGEVGVISQDDTPKLDSRKIVVLGLGSGNGRIETELYKSGFRVIATDIDPTNIEVARKKAPEGMDIVMASWHKLPFDTVTWRNESEKTPVITGTKERSFLHNRRPAEWLRLFDEVRRVTAHNGFLFFDIPDLNSGVYKAEVEAYKDNMKEHFGLEIPELNIIFDGPDVKTKINRLAISEEQVDILARLFGYVVVSKSKEEGNYDMINTKYVLAKDQNWISADINPGELWESMKKLGVLSFATDFNMWIESWGMTLGQAILFGTDYVGAFHSSQTAIEATKNNSGPRVWAEKIGNKVLLISKDPIQKYVDDRDPFGNY